MSQRNELLYVILGILLLLPFHLVALGLIFLTAYIVQSLSGGYAFMLIVGAGTFVFSLWQLIYVIPLCLWLKNQGKISVMKGVIIGAILTLLGNGGCFLLVGAGGIIS
jgi:hypothetical protein